MTGAAKRNTVEAQKVGHPQGDILRYAATFELFQSRASGR